MDAFYKALRAAMRHQTELAAMASKAMRAAHKSMWTPSKGTQ